MKKRQKQDFKSIKKLIVYSKKYIPAVIVCIVFAIVSSIATIIGPEKIQDLMTIITSGLIPGSAIDFDAFNEATLKLVIIYLLGALASYVMTLISSIVSAKLSKEFRTDINKKLVTLPLSFYDSSTRGDVMSVITNDVDTLSQALSQSIANILNAIVLFVGITVMMFKTSWVLALITIGVSLVGFIAVILIGAKSQKQFHIRQTTLGEMNSDIEEVFSNINLVREYGANEYEINKFKEINTKLYESNRKSQLLTNMMMPIMTLVSNIAYALIFLVGILMSVKSDGSIDPTVLATLVTFQIYSRLYSQPLSTFSQSITYVQQASSAANRVFKYLEETSEEDETGKPELLHDVEGNVEFRHIKFGYNESKEIIHDFSLNVKKGMKVAIVGPTGAGKTTIVNLLMRFYEINDGEILIDSINTKSTTRDNVRSQFDMILQDTWLFEGTIRDNLRYNDLTITDDKIIEALSKVGLKHYIETLPLGLDTIINENLSLSEGQKQELTIARAILRDKPMLILDEATSNVDTRTEIVIQEAMDMLMENRTSFVIAHRLSTIKNADLILVLNNGDIVETGTHTELLEKQGFYSKLYNSQFEIN